MKNKLYVSLFAVVVSGTITVLGSVDDARSRIRSATMGIVKRNAPLEEGITLNKAHARASGAMTGIANVKNISRADKATFNSLPDMFTIRSNNARPGWGSTVAGVNLGSKISDINTAPISTTPIVSPEPVHFIPELGANSSTYAPSKEENFLRKIAAQLDEKANAKLNKIANDLARLRQEQPAIFQKYFGNFERKSQKPRLDVRAVSLSESSNEYPKNEV